MLAFIMSKMQMLLFAVGVAAVVTMFMMFVSNMGLSDIASGEISNVEKAFLRQSSNDIASCSFDTVTIPSKLTYGNGTNNLYYEMRFKVVQINEKDALVISINEYKKKNIIASRLIPTDSKIILIKEDMLGTVLTDDYYIKSGEEGEITLYPRSAYKNNSGPPNIVAFVKKKIGDQDYIYVIPASSYNTHDTGLNDAQYNVLKVGCYELKNTSTSKTSDTQIQSCFNVTGTKTITWKTCLNYGLG
ncbi:MAG: hypothetical protein PHQ98_02570 [Candidatus ainarchaeum sp.]|nr:hypothetical protein [Candidatus ainarchaeum sp.]